MSDWACEGHELWNVRVRRETGVPSIAQRRGLVSLFGVYEIVQGRIYFFQGGTFHAMYFSAVYRYDGSVLNAC